MSVDLVRQYYDTERTMEILLQAFQDNLADIQDAQAPWVMTFDNKTVRILSGTWNKTEVASMSYSPSNVQGVSDIVDAHNAGLRYADSNGSWWEDEIVSIVKLLTPVLDYLDQYHQFPSDIDASLQNLIERVNYYRMAFQPAQTPVTHRNRDFGDEQPE